MQAKLRLQDQTAEKHPAQQPQEAGLEMWRALQTEKNQQDKAKQPRQVVG